MDAARPAAPGRRGRRGPAGPGRPAHRTCPGSQPPGRTPPAWATDISHEPGLLERGHRGGDLPGRPAAADGPLPAAGGRDHHPQRRPRAPGRQRAAAGHPGRDRLRVPGRVVGAAGAGAACGPWTRIRSPRPCAGRPSTSARSTRPPSTPGGRPFFRTTTGGGGLFVKVLGREAQQRPAVPLLPLVALPRPGRRGDRVVP